jgi:hypothetical protein
VLEDPSALPVEEVGSVEPVELVTSSPELAEVTLVSEPEVEDELEPEPSVAVVSSPQPPRTARARQKR